MSATLCIILGLFHSFESLMADIFDINHFYPVPERQRRIQEADNKVGVFCEVNLHLSSKYLPIVRLVFIKLTIHFKYTKEGKEGKALAVYGPFRASKSP